MTDSTSSAPAPGLHLLPWDRPLLPQAVAWLTREWQAAAAPLDLSDHLVIVPTRQSGRRLREALAGHAAAHQQAVFSPRVIVPQQLLSEGAASPDVASATDTQLAWIEVLRAIDLAEFSEVFPVAPPARNFPWAARLARELTRLQATLAENGLRLRDPADTARFGAFPETARWRQLAALEARYDAVLARRGRRDAQAARIAFAANPAAPAGVRRIVLLGTPDPLPLVLHALEKLARVVRVDVVVFGPRGSDLGRPAAASSGPDSQTPGSAARTRAPAPPEDFDAWGRPIVEAWRRRAADLPKFTEHVHLLADPASQAARLVATARAYAEPARTFGLGIADREILAPLHNAMQRAGLLSFDPEGRPRRDEPLHRILELCGELTRESWFTTAAALVRCPDVLAWLAAEIGEGFTAARLLAELDALQAAHLPATLTAARDHASGAAARALDAIARLRAEVRHRPFPENARAALAMIYGSRTFNLERADDARAVAVANEWNETLTHLADAATRFPGVAAADLFDLARETFGEGVRFDDKPEGALDLQGWLELLWEDAPHVVVAGLNEGHAPEAVVGDPFLPEALRERLGLKTNAGRLARDAYLFAAIAACRRESGRLDVLFGKATSAGDPLRPSRLLLNCADDELPARVQFLFTRVSGNQSDTPWRRAFQLTPPPPRAGGIARLSVTSFRNYLRCPFRFYLQHGLRLDEVDPHKAELDERDFGQLCHRALETLGHDPRMRECTDEAVLRDLLLGELERGARAQFGTEVPVPLVVQLASARQRLARAASVQAQERAAGWRIERVESPFELPVGGLLVRGTIDRVERHTGTGAVRVLDYKTKDRATPPRESHVRRWKRGEALEDTRDYARFAIDGEDFVWLDLQLPLYLHALRAEFGADVACGYFALPRAVSETAVAMWQGYSAAWHEASWRCAEGIVADVRAGRFWPPAELAPEQDDFASLFHQGAAESVAWPGKEKPE